MQNNTIFFSLISYTSIYMIIIATIGLSAFACIVPDDGQIITNTTQFCKGSYYLPKGILISASNIAIDCAGSKLRGDGLGFGLTISGKTDITIKNCIITDFSSAILANSSSYIKISGNTLTNNVESGVFFYNTHDSTVKNNIIKDNQIIDIYQEAGSINNVFENNSGNTDDMIISDNNTINNISAKDNNTKNSTNNNNDDNNQGTNISTKTDNKSITQNLCLDKCPACKQLCNGTDDAVKVIIYKTPSALPLNIDFPKDFNYSQIGFENYTGFKDKLELLYKDTIDGIKMEKAIIFYKEKRPEIIIYIKVNETMDINVFEDIPKKTANNSDEIESDISFLVMKDDPLLVWSFSEVRTDIKIRYSVNKVVELPKTLPIKIKQDDVVADVVAPISKATQDKKTGDILKFILMIAIIPVIAGAIIYFSRYRKR